MPSDLTLARRRPIHKLWQSLQHSLQGRRQSVIWFRIIIAACACSGHPAFAEPTNSLRIQQCLSDAAHHHGVDLTLLSAIAWTESRLDPIAHAINSNGSSDYGLMQINDWWLPRLVRFGISRQDLLDPCISAYVGAWILAQEIQRHGPTWRAVGAYNSPTPQKQQAYAAKVYRRLQVLTQR
ncbi:lytic transglycosylase domain-containing protein [Stutzerimonas stutzeri]